MTARRLVRRAVSRSGRDSRDSPAVAALAEAIKQGAASGKQVRPPNLRSAEPGGAACANCRYFKLRSVRGDGACRLYGGFPVNARQVCDSFRPK
jgi:hypothetical protein